MIGFDGSRGSLSVVSIGQNCFKYRQDWRTMMCDYSVNIVSGPFSLLYDYVPEICIRALTVNSFLVQSITRKYFDYNLS